MGVHDMSLRIGDVVAVTKGTYADKKGKILDLKWNLVNVRFDSGECEWVDGKHIKIWNKHDTTTAKA